MQQPERNIQHAEMNAVLTVDYRGEEIMQQPEMIIIQHAEMNMSPESRRRILFGRVQFRDSLHSIGRMGQLEHPQIVTVTS